ncbi:PQQ-binding-like beta-propeller repeat protein [Mycolicibacterium hodleri]|uniref:Pyrrolo-quinoline quinone n=1 Tax=Mycolicibacterium hodleri TaxID=49897 RepID=A0A502EJW1_9MYCO|nr:PQQ-binding-like beta-propeller repeat protein [Mycolicibacterium hodleri]TPG36800.1 pyrrolo-quinoline quinone [Mycolicibacterium hodleri]
MSAPGKTVRRVAAVTVAVFTTLILSACGNTDSWVQARPAEGWSAQYGNAGNSSYVQVDGSGALRLDWIRSVKGSVESQVALSSGDYLAVNAQTAGGCSLMAWETDNRARQRWCTRLWQGGGLSSPLFDGFDNLYVGQPGSIMSFPATQWFRWRHPVIGLPWTPRLLSEGQLLVVTHLGQVLVYDAHSGDVVGTALDLVEGVDPTDSQRGLADCQLGRPRCPVAAAPAFSAATGIVVTTLWEPDAAAPEVVGLRYRPGQTPLLSRDWTSTAVGGGPLSSPVLSGDGNTVYVNGRDGRLWALDTADGRARWSVPLNFQPQTPPSVSPDGLIVSGGGPDSTLTAIKDGGDRGEVAWTHDDVEPLTTSSLAGTTAAYTVVRDRDGMALLVFDPADGHTLNSYPLPGATGYPVGVSIGHDRRVVAATSDGRVFGFAPA